MGGFVGLFTALTLAGYNASHVNRNTPEEHRNQELMARVATTPIPERAAILTKYWPAMTLRYVYWIQAGRPDVSVIHAARGTHLELAAHLHNAGRKVYFTGDVLPKRIESQLAARTPGELRSIGLLSLGDLPPIPLTEPP
jgi:hypothetical protein